MIRRDYMKVIEKISSDLNVPVLVLEESLRQSRKLVKHIKIPKNTKDGSYRRVYQPSRKLKVIQYWLENNIFQNLKIHDSAVAYKKNTSVKDNAFLHQRSRFFIKMDFKDFFPSIKFIDFSDIVKESNDTYEEDALLDVVKRSCFYIDDILPIGYPTSPSISNAVMYKFDVGLSAEILDKDVYGEAVYTRYADDLTFSTNLKGACNSFEKLVKKKLKLMDSPNVRVNNKKTRYVSSSGGSAFITGLRVCYDGHITIHRKYKDRVRLLLSLYSKNTLKKEDIYKLKGHLSYIKFVDGMFYTKLQNKYFNEIEKIFST